MKQNPNEKTQINTTITVGEKETIKKLHRKYNELIRIGLRQITSEESYKQRYNELEEQNRALMRKLASVGGQFISAQEKITALERKLDESTAATELKLRNLSREQERHEPREHDKEDPSVLE